MKDALFSKAMSVVRSCETREQCDVAKKYVDLYTRRERLNGVAESVINLLRGRLYWVCARRQTALIQKKGGWKSLAISNLQRDMERGFYA
ncbi:MAG: hypothetical protein ACYSSO_07405 [Planctomycetota bacterium]|jgi:hypothetical protein